VGVGWDPVGGWLGPRVGWLGLWEGVDSALMVLHPDSFWVRMGTILGWHGPVVIIVRVLVGILGWFCWNPGWVGWDSGGGWLGPRVGWLGLWEGVDSAIMVFHPDSFWVRMGTILGWHGPVVIIARVLVGILGWVCWEPVGVGCGCLGPRVGWLGLWEGVDSALMVFHPDSFWVRVGTILGWHGPIVIVEGRVVVGGGVWPFIFFLF
jgi:hypothetical protein